METTTKHDQMRAVVRQYHSGQTRNGGHVPYAQHCERVAHLLGYVLDKTGEATGARRENILLAGLDHDLLEDAAIDQSSLSLRFGDNVVALISEVTNTRGDDSATRRMRASKARDFARDRGEFCMRTPAHRVRTARLAAIVAENEARLGI